MKFCTTLLAIFIFTQTSFSQTYILRSHFDTTNIPALSDYSKNSSWASLPAMDDYADSVPAGLADNQANALADVFYIHPTIYYDKPNDKYIWNADIGNAVLNDKVDGSAILYQASVFNGSCRVYAPRYRQAHYYCFLTGDSCDKKESLDLAYLDVRNAFQYYLDHYNNHRPVVIASHSQGTIHAVRLLQEFFMNKPLQKQLVVAYLLGMPVPTDSLPSIPPCRDSLETGCFTCWNSFEAKYVPKYYNKGLVHAVCTNPLTWRIENGYAPKSLNKGAVVLSFSKVNPQFCDAEVHNGLLWVNKPKFPGSIFLINPIYHKGDFNLFYMNVRENVALRISEYFEKGNRN